MSVVEKKATKKAVLYNVCRDEKTRQWCVGSAHLITIWDDVCSGVYASQYAFAGRVLR